MKINFVIPCLLGLEKLIADEMKDLGAENVVSENGRVLFSGDENLLARANICSRYAERIQILVGTFKAMTFEELFELRDGYEYSQNMRVVKTVSEPKNH